MENSDEKTRDTEEGVAAQKGFFPFLFAGFILVFIGIAIIAAATLFQAGNSVDFGAVIFIGPIPIVLGAGPDATLIVFLSAILAVLSVIIAVAMSKRNRDVDA
ncbi:MAG: DUF131 domain-containing protein [Candidatus Bathyarchaeota archaeon]|nr:DUF131 domain-containing protein [Candidatus Bathyarchaeota archaeon]